MRTVKVPKPKCCVFDDVTSFDVVGVQQCAIIGKMTFCYKLICYFKNKCNSQLNEHLDFGTYIRMYF